MITFSAAAILCFSSILSSCMSQNPCQSQRLAAVLSGQHKVRGANLGSWFVMENFMSYPIWNSNFCGLEVNNNSKSGNETDGQYMFEQCIIRTRGPQQLQQILQKHWSTFITESTFRDMSSKGINAVRIPVGWWNIYDNGGSINNQITSPRNYATGSLAYIDKAFVWGQRYGIAILLGMHAAPGSQSGAANSSPGKPGQKEWASFPANVDQTIASMQLYAQRYGKKPALLGFYLLNEPDGISLQVLQDYYQRAYKAVRQFSTNAYIIINPMIAHPTEDGTEDYWKNFMSNGYSKVVMDDHFYSGFGGPGATTDTNAALSFITNNRASEISKYQQVNSKPLMIGEWSALWNADQSRSGDFVKAQVQVYNNASFGWFYWSWLTNPQQNTWSMSQAFQLGWMPQLDSPAC